MFDQKLLEILKLYCTFAKSLSFSETGSTKVAQNQYHKKKLLFLSATFIKVVTITISQILEKVATIAIATEVLIKKVANTVVPTFEVATVIVW